MLRYINSRTYFIALLEFSLKQLISSERKRLSHHWLLVLVFTAIMMFLNHRLHSFCWPKNKLQQKRNDIDNWKSQTCFYRYQPCPSAYIRGLSVIGLIVKGGCLLQKNSTRNCDYDCHCCHVYYIQSNCLIHQMCYLENQHLLGF